MQSQIFLLYPEQPQPTEVTTHVLLFGRGGEDTINRRVFTQGLPARQHTGSGVCVSSSNKWKECRKNSCQKTKGTGAGKVQGYFIYLIFITTV